MNPKHSIVQSLEGLLNTVDELLCNAESVINDEDFERGHKEMAAAQKQILNLTATALSSLENRIEPEYAMHVTALKLARQRAELAVESYSQMEWV